MKVIDKTPLQNEKGEIGFVQRIQCMLEYGFNWYPELDAQKNVVSQLERVLEKGFTLIRNITLHNSQIVEPIILIGPPGVYVLYATPLAGFYEAKGDQWNTTSNGRSLPAPINLLTRTARLARALQVFLDQNGITLPGPVEGVLISTNPAMHIESLRPLVRVVMSDAIKQFAGSLLQARPILKSEFVYDLADRIVTPRPKTPPAGLEAARPAPAKPVPVGAPGQAVAQPRTPPAQAGQAAPRPPSPQAATAEPPSAPPPQASRAQSIFQAADEAQPFNPADLSFAFDEGAIVDSNSSIPKNLRETSPSQRLPLPTKKRSALNPRQLILLGVMAVVECCILGGFGYFFITHR